VYHSAGIKQVNYVWFYASEWHSNKSSVLKKVSHLKYPLYIKPSNGGSSIGISKVKVKGDLENAIDVACHYDRKIVVEESAEGYKEINISVLGNSGSDLKTSVCEQPVASHEVLTFSDKYESSNAKSAGMASAKRLIPAPIKNSTALEISKLAKLAFEAIDASGVSRVDFLVSPDEKTIFLNEINTIPGSLSFYLWEATGLHFSDLLDQLVQLALAKYQATSSLTHTFSNNLLSKLGETLNASKLKG
jgi:D-alanine-D-alanine ligase